MSAKTLLRIAFGVIVFHIIGHTIGHFTWKKTEDPVLLEIIHQMEEHDFNFMGSSQTLDGHHAGYSALFEIMLVMLAFLSWMISSRIEQNSSLAFVVLVMGVSLVISGIVETIYFFPLAGGSSLVAGILLLFGWYRSLRKSAYAS